GGLFRAPGNQVWGPCIALGAGRYREPAFSLLGACLFPNGTEGKERSRLRRSAAHYSQSHPVFDKGKGRVSIAALRRCLLPDAKARHRRSSWRGGGRVGLLGDE
ncbi:unnamed protein product, partial [Ectocarpus sp. 12 AP-2014]